MSETHITIEGEFTTLNEYIRAERTHRHKAAQIKKNETDCVAWSVNGVEKVTDYPVDITFIWYCSDRRTDPDNIAYAKKYILDGLQKAGVLRGDGWKEINGLHDLFYIDPQSPRVEVILESIT